jgi:hypothetical protein
MANNLHTITPRTSASIPALGIKSVTTYDLRIGGEFVNTFATFEEAEKAAR